MASNKKFSLRPVYLTAMVAGAIVIFSFVAALYVVVKEKREIVREQKYRFTLESVVPHTLELPPLPPEADVVLAYAGVISGIDADGRGFTISTMRGDRHVSYTAATDLYLVKTPPPDEREELLAAGKEITETKTRFSGSLVVGDRIRVESSQNIKDEASFDATRIEVVR